MIIDLRQIDTTTNEGKLLLAAIAKITGESQTNKTPNEVIKQLDDMCNGMGTPQRSECSDCQVWFPHNELAIFTGQCEDCYEEMNE